ncbi:MAG: tRNA pseudouridine(55) synthase TruB [Holosporaceae bacterium]|jgi:tRNA pseudouridine55 synthase|nr:tRNA pseudouridine(55) synthase TruB [Holosporaceae bacterium]
MMNGWLCLDKPAGISSNLAMIKARKILGARTGYVGTLDPFATGVLPIAVGEARKFIHFLGTSQQKEYEFTVIFGKTTDTMDRSGKITGESSKIPTTEEVKHILPDFLGRQWQMPPIFSAIKISGRRACDRVRAGENIELSPRKIEVFSLFLEGAQDNIFRFCVVCSPGTYVRSLARDIAEKVGSRGYVDALKRTKSGFFLIKQAIPLENLSKIEDTDELVRLLISIESPLDDIPALYLGSDLVKMVQNGLRISLKSQSSLSWVRIHDDFGGDFRGIGSVSDDGLLKAVRMCVY